MNYKYDAGYESCYEEYEDLIKFVDMPNNPKYIAEHLIKKIFDNDILSLEEFTRIWTEEMKLRNIIK
jgi:hypothetical protein